MERSTLLAVNILVISALYGSFVETQCQNKFGDAVDFELNERKLSLL